MRLLRGSILFEIVWLSGHRGEWTSGPPPRTPAAYRDRIQHRIQCWVMPEGAKNPDPGPGEGPPQDGENMVGGKEKGA